MSLTSQTVARVSVHGGHSGQFCHHASDALEDVICAYINQGFSWVGITEHMAPLVDAYRYPDESRDSLTAEFLMRRFHEYFAVCRELKHKYQDQITLFTAFETETYTGSLDLVNNLVSELRPDYLVGSVHHVNDICIDYDAELFQTAVDSAGGLVELYLAYFDAQYAMLQNLAPAVVGHFDLIRKYDTDYLNTLAHAEVQKRISRNLDLIAELGLILDFNLRGFDKAVEQYPCTAILEQAIARGIAVVPGDDSHGVNSVGRNYDRGIAILQELGASTDWPRPRLIQYNI
jgi:histidinol-phosphatase (PHP family)